MRYKNGQIVYSPSDLINFMESPFTSWMDRLFLEKPPHLKPEAPGAAQALLQKKGDEHEIAFLESLRRDKRQICEIPVDFESDALELTRTAIKTGYEIIYQGVLSCGEFEGRSDFLVRNDNGHLYEVWDTKLARKSKPYFLLQLCCYAEMLAEIQGTIPQQIAVVLGDKSIKRFDTSEYFDYFRCLKNNFLKFHREFDPKMQPSPEYVPAMSRWASYAESLLKERDDLLQIANIRKVTKRKLEKSGITTMTQLSQCSYARVSGVSDNTYQALKQQARLQVQSQGLDRPLFELIDCSAEHASHKGLFALPPKSEKDVFFDMEGYPHFEGGLEYLFGAVVENGSNGAQFHDWWATCRATEKIAFENFVDWIFDRWKSDSTMHVYHYAAYEVSALRRLMGRHATREFEVDTLLRNEVFVDLYQIVKQALRVGEPSYSIKYIEHLYKEKRASEVATAMDSVVFFERWLEHRDGETPADSAILRSIRDYNEEDCISTWQLAGFLRQVQNDNGIRYIPRPKAFPNSKEPEPPPRLEDLLAAQLLERVAQCTDAEQARIDTLLAHLMNFHFREIKPAYWRMFDWHSMTEEELFEDSDCLAGLERTATPPLPIKQSIEFEYAFNPDQDTILCEGDKCIATHDLSIKPGLSHLDSEKGIARLRQGKNMPPLPDRLNLMPNQIIGAKSIAESLQRIAQRRIASGDLPAALQSFLLREPPSIVEHTAGSPIVDETSVESVYRVVRNMNHTCLFIQGPPGSGKTFTAAHVILRLIQDGRRVGVSSNSHKAIENLLSEIEKLCTDSVPLHGVKIGSDGDGKESRFSTARISWETTGKAAFTSEEKYNLFGGTAYAFSIVEAVGQLDYLFVDEAGQVAVANLAGMAPSAKNIVLIGDQMQLDQPIQGSHPGESGQSTLQYLLQGEGTVKPTHGIFLQRTYRMHPQLCRFVSDAVYQSRLSSAPHTEQRVLIPPNDSRWIKQEAGLLYVPVSHTDNVRCSYEEAEVIKLITQDLMRCDYFDGEVTRTLTLDDILFVAPYNMQVKLIKEKIPGAKAASVDKFQGRQAPVVILSMCTSDASSAPRGLEFIFSRNRLNVAVSRAKTLAVVVGSPELANATCSTVEQMSLVNFFCKLIHYGTTT